VPCEADFSIYRQQKKRWPILISQRQQPLLDENI
jgi:hypothetical protein